MGYQPIGHDPVEIAVHKAQQREVKESEKRWGRLRAIDYAICPDCAASMVVVSGPWRKLLLSQDILRCEACGTTHKRQWVTD